MFRIRESDIEEAINHSLLHGDMNRVWDISQKGQRITGTVDPQLVQREKDRSLRAQLSSANGDTVEIHDQFYRDHKLLLVLFRVMAVMPITRSQPGRITFSWTSSATIYAIFFYIVTTAIVLIVGETKQVDDITNINSLVNC
uniref:Uncharacterized protein n=1 Tax=Phlebotomus papatasi TaxID=29031 RepID=A0A240SYF9_PHLPP